MAAVTALILPFTVVDPSGPLAPQGWAIDLLCLVPTGSLAAATTVMVIRAGPRPLAGAPAGAGVAHAGHRG